MGRSKDKLAYQMDLLQTEIDTINSTIRQMDDISKSMKEWCIGIWTAAIGGAYYFSELRELLILTAIVPLLFWLSDTHHRVVQRKFIWRSLAISDWFNGKDFGQSLDNDEVVGLRLFDVASRGDKGDAERAAFIGFWRVFWFRTISVFYGGLIVCSVALGVWTRSSAA